MLHDSLTLATAGVTPGPALPGLTILTATDSYKASHATLYPPGAQYISSYLESRFSPFPRARFFGLQAILKRLFLQPITEADVAFTARLFERHGEPFHAPGWLRIVRECGGLLPLEIRAVPEGFDIPTGNVLMQIVNTVPWAPWLTSYVEAALLHVWYPTTVCTVSGAARTLLLEALAETSDDPAAAFAVGKLHDFGLRGTTIEEAAALGGLAHLVNFPGSDTVPALLAAWAYYGVDEPGAAARSIPAMEHSTVMTWSREREIDAYRNALAQYGRPGSVVALVVDTYDQRTAIADIIGSALRDEIVASGATVVVRLDSGDPRVEVPWALQTLADRFGCTYNHRGYRVLASCVRVLQGDGMDLDAIRDVCESVVRAGFSVENVAFGMGGGLLQKVHRDTLGFAMKPSAAMIDGVWIDTYKDPKTDVTKRSKRGRLALTAADRLWNDANVLSGVATVRIEELGEREDLLRPVYRDGALLIDESLDVVRRRVPTP